MVKGNKKTHLAVKGNKPTGSMSILEHGKALRLKILVTANNTDAFEPCEVPS